MRNYAGEDRDIWPRCLLPVEHGALPVEPEFMFAKARREAARAFLPFRAAPGSEPPRCARRRQHRSSCKRGAFPARIHTLSTAPSTAQLPPGVNPRFISSVSVWFTAPLSPHVPSFAGRRFYVIFKFIEATQLTLSRVSLERQDQPQTQGLLKKRLRAAVRLE